MTGSGGAGCSGSAPTSCRLDPPLGARGTSHHTERPALEVGDKVRLDYADSRWWWLVQAVSENFTACVHQVPFQPAGTLCYTVLDWRNEVRGPCDLIGQGYGDGTYSQQQCEQMLAEFEHYEVFIARVRMAGGSLPSERTLRVSYRNRVPLKVLEIRRPRARLVTEDRHREAVDV